MLRAKNLVKAYASKKRDTVVAVDDISLDFDEKGFVFICGKSGSGKSTLLNILSGMDAADSGSLEIAGRDSSTFKMSDFDNYRNNYVGYIFQDYGIIEQLNVKENIKLSLELKGEKVSDEQVETVLKQVGLEQFVDRKMHEMSGGQKQRIAIARALIKKPKILFADEPTGNLDNETTKQVLDLFRELSKETLVICISHDSDAAFHYADRVITLADGRVVSDKKKTKKVDVDALKQNYQKKIDEHFKDYKQKNIESEDKFEKIKSSLPTGAAFKLALSSFKAKKIRSIFVVFLTILALSVFILSDFMNRYDYNTSVLNTMRGAGITTLFVEKRQEIIVFDEPFQIPDEMQLSDLAFVNSLVNNNTMVSHPMNLRIRQHQESLPNSLGQYNMTISNIVLNDAGVFNANTLNSFYKSKLLLGEFPTEQEDLIEILISDFTANSIMRVGARFTNKDIFPNTGWNSILGGELEFLGIKLKIVGIFETTYKETMKNYDNMWENRFHWNNTYRSILTTHDALFKQLEKNDFFVTYGSFNLGNSTRLDPDITAVVGGETFFDAIKNTATNFGADVPSWITSELLDLVMPIKYIDDYNSGTTLGANDMIISFSMLQDILDAHGFDPVTLEPVLTYDQMTADDFKNLNISMRFLDNGRQATKTNAKIVGVFDDATLFDWLITYGGVTVQEGFFEFDFGFESLVVASPLMLETFIRGTLAMTGVFVDTARNTRTQNLAFLEKLGDNLFGVVFQQSRDLETIRMLFNFLGPLLKWVSWILFFFVMLLIFNFISSSVAAKQREIGILRTLGARGIDTAKMFIIEGLLILVVSCGVALGISALSLGAMNNIFSLPFSSGRLVVLSYHYISVILGVLASLGIVALASLIPLIRICLMKPVESTKKNS